MTSLKFYMERGPRGWQPLAVEVDATTGKPIVYNNGYFIANRIRRHAMGGLVFDEAFYDRVSPGWVRITEHQAREIDKNLHYGSMERITGLFFGQYSNELGRRFRQGWQEYLDKGMHPKQLKVPANAIVKGYRVRVQFYSPHYTDIRYRTVVGIVESVRVWSDRNITIRLEGQKEHSSRVYGAKEFVVVLPTEVKEEVKI